MDINTVTPHGRSSSTNLLSYWNYVIDVFEKDCEVHLIYTDFAKAFVRVNCDILISKLNAMDFDKFFTL